MTEVETQRVERLAADARLAIQRRDPKTALALLDRLDGASLSAAFLMDKALALRMLGDLTGALAAIDAALFLEPCNFLALLSKGALVDRLQGWKAAAVIYKNALAIAPADTDLPEGIRPPVRKAHEVVARYNDALADHLRRSVNELRARHADQSLGRFDEGLDIFSGRARPYPQQPLLLHYPRLPAIPFHARADFPWLGDLEALTPIIQDELAGALREQHDDFAPYIAFPPGAPVNQWGQLNHSRLWSSYFLWKDGVRQAQACARCPRTAKLLEGFPMAEQPGFAPTAMFSALEARTRIPPHTGSANIRLIVHLPLILPGPARFRVGAETRTWRIGEAWVFDDTIEHEAWNDADALRVILIFDIWNPLLSVAERELITAMMAAKNAFAAQA
jgi:aspartate beta-hydroxylase